MEKFNFLDIYLLHPEILLTRAVRTQNVFSVAKKEQIAQNSSKLSFRSSLYGSKILFFTCVIGIPSWFLIFNRVKSSFPVSCFVLFFCLMQTSWQCTVFHLQVTQLLFLIHREGSSQCNQKHPAYLSVLSRVKCRCRATKALLVLLRKRNREVEPTEERKKNAPFVSRKA